MALDARQGRREEEIAAVPFPHTGKPWFEALPVERREEMERSFREDLRRYCDLVQRQRRHAYVDIGLASALFLVFDQFFAPHATGASGVFAVAVGAAVGFLCVLIHANRLLSGAVGLAAFFLVQVLSRGGLTGLHMIIFYPFAALCMLLGYKREERSYDA